MDGSLNFAFNLDDSTSISDSCLNELRLSKADDAANWGVMTVGVPSSNLGAPFGLAFEV